MKKCEKPAAAFTAVALVVIMGLYIYHHPVSVSLYKNSNFDYSTSPFGGIMSGVGLRQVFPMETAAKIDAVEVRLATYARKNDSYFNMSILLNDTTVCQKRVYGADLEDNSFFAIADNLDLAVNPGDELGILILPDGEVSAGKAITAWIMQCPTKGALYRVTPEGDVPVEGEIVINIIQNTPITTHMATHYLKSNPIIPAVGGIVLLLLIGALFYYLLTDNREKETE